MKKNFVSVDDFDGDALRWLANFEDNLDDESLKLTGRQKNKKPFWNFFEKHLDDDGEYFIMMMRAINAFNWAPAFVAKVFEEFKTKYSDINELYSVLVNGSVQLVKLLSYVHHKIYLFEKIEDFSDEWLNDIRKLSSMKNVTLIGIDGKVVKIPKK